jgi:hypothetical protein
VLAQVLGPGGDDELLDHAIGGMAPKPKRGRPGPGRPRWVAAQCRFSGGTMTTGQCAWWVT